MVQNEFKSGFLVATLPGTLPYRVSAKTGWPGVSIIGERASLNGSFYLNKEAGITFYPGPSMICYWDVKQPKTATP